jgi:hypothetical protein
MKMRCDGAFIDIGVPKVYARPQALFAAKSS